MVYSTQIYFFNLNNAEDAILPALNFRNAKTRLRNRRNDRNYYFIYEDLLLPYRSQKYTILSILIYVGQETPTTQFILISLLLVRNCGRLKLNSLHIRIRADNDKMYYVFDTVRIVIVHAG